MQKLIIFLLFIFFIVACKDPGDTVIGYSCSTSPIPTYTGTIKAIMDSSCATVGCHDAITKADGYELSNYTTTKLNATEKLLLSIEHRSGVKPMPKGGNIIPEAQRIAIYCWVQNGTPE
jgi:hypothetical protein